MFKKSPNQQMLWVDTNGNRFTFFLASNKCLL